MKITPDLEHLTALVELFVSSYGDTLCELSARPQALSCYVKRQQVLCRNGYGRAVLSFAELDVRRDKLIWAPGHPNLIDVDIVIPGNAMAVRDEAEKTAPQADGDRVQTYFGMRSVAVRNGHILLNGEVICQRLVLDQGYWKDSLLTPPSSEAVIKDLELVKAMGFNGVRKHQKIEDPLFYYYADRMGILVWGELPSAYDYHDYMVKSSVNEMQSFLERDFNHPCIITWVPVNESWGVRNVLTDDAQQSYVQAMAHLIKALDTTRLVSANDGWEQPGCTDICAVHDYTYTHHTLGKYDKRWEEILASGPDARMLFAQGHAYHGQPVILSEYGGIAMDDGSEGWGYLEKAKSEEEFLQRLHAVTEDLVKCQRFAGFCYTQLTDVMQEMNGLVTMEREPKAPVEKLREVFAYDAQDAPQLFL